MQVLIGVAAAAIVSGLLGTVLLRLHATTWRPPAHLFPPTGAVFHSALEGFTQRVLRSEGDALWLQLTLAPGAQGPPPHVHSRFAERFRVVAGTIAVHLQDGTHIVSAGEELLVRPGKAHRVSNPGESNAVVEGLPTAEYALPRSFGLFLAQAYAYFDEAPARSRLPGVLFQLSWWSPLCDVWLAGPPMLLQRALFAVLRPLALALGYRPWYARYAPAATSAQPIDGR